MPVLETGVALIGAIGGAIELYDKLYPRLVRLLANETAREPRIKIAATPDKQSLVATHEGHPVRTVTYSELEANLGPDDLSAIQMHERRMETLSRLFATAYEALPNLGPAERVQEEQRLLRHVHDMKQDLIAITDYIQRIGFDLEDHYSMARHLVETRL